MGNKEFVTVVKKNLLLLFIFTPVLINMMSVNPNAGSKDSIDLDTYIDLKIYSIQIISDLLKILSEVSQLYAEIL